MQTADLITQEVTKSFRATKPQRCWTNLTSMKAMPDTGRAGQTHYRVYIVSEAFKGKTSSERHG
jgi:stress-induced morphogen